MSTFRKLKNPAKRSLACPTLSPGRILIVDDDLCHCEFNAEALRQNGYKVNIASGGEAGWEELQTRCYNLLITENDLIVPSGVGLLRRLRSACLSLPVIIAIKALPSWQSADYPWLLQATKLLKPYSFKDLLDVVGDILPAPGRGREELVSLPDRENQTASVALRLR